jgi:hypothetical protein
MSSEKERRQKLNESQLKHENLQIQQYLETHPPIECAPDMQTVYILSKIKNVG